MPQYWAGICDGKIDTRETKNGFGGWGNGHSFRAPAIFTSKTEALKHYEVVRKVTIIVVTPKKRTR